MKKYNITVNGTTYEVTVEEIVSGQDTTVPASPAVSVPKTAPAVVKNTPSASAGSIPVKAPMPGNIVKVNVRQGDKVKSGDVLCVLEAMKMENDIVAPSDGTIASVDCAKDASVTTDAILFTMN